MATFRRLGLFPWCIWPSQLAYYRYYDPNNSEPWFRERYGLILEQLILRQDRALAMYYRVKKWEMKFTHYSIDPNIGEDPPLDIETVVTMYWERAAASEKSFVCPQFGTSKAIPLVPVGGVAVDSLTQAETILSDGTFYVASRFHGQGIPFDVEFGLPGTFTSGEPGLPIHNFFAGYDQEGVKTIGTHLGFAVIDAYQGQFIGGMAGMERVAGRVVTEGQLEILGAVSDFSFTQPDYFPGGVADLTIKAAEFWPYDPGDGGGPIYDTNTGAQIRPMP
jgi:hypothetical protein